MWRSQLETMQVPDSLISNLIFKKLVILNLLTNSHKWHIAYKNVFTLKK